MKNVRKFPKISVGVLGVIVLASLFAGVLAPYGFDEMDSMAVNLAPCAEHIFGTDNLGRDLFSMILYGGRVSIRIGILSGLISTAVAVIYGTAAGIAWEWASDLLMRLTELIMSIPSILLIIFLQALWGRQRSRLLR